jgi:hypothetical protein
MMDYNIWRHEGVLRFSGLGQRLADCNVRILASHKFSADISPPTRLQMEADCQRFQKENAEILMQFKKRLDGMILRLRT